MSGFKNFFSRLKKDVNYRSMVAFIISFIISILYALYNGVYGILFSSVWFGALAAYYIILSAVRGGVVFKTRSLHKNGNISEEEKRIKEFKIHLISGVMLIVLTLALSSAVTLMVIEGRGFEHPGLLIFVAAVYTFTKIIISIINFVRNRRTDDFILRTTRNIGLADALVSVLALQTAMLSAFGSGEDVRWANASTGGAVCLLIIALGIFMITVSVLNIKKTRERGNADEATE